MTIELLSKDLEEQYTDFILGFDKSLFYHSLLFRDFVKEYLGHKDHYFLAISNNKIVGVLPSFLSATSIGNCLNSLPFFGSNGGLIVQEKDSEEIKKHLLKAFYDLAEEKDCITSTLINSPFEDHTDVYKSYQPDFYDRRIGQITEIPQDGEDIEEKLLYSFSAFTRRMIRKAMKNEVVVEKSGAPDTFQFIKDSHVINMENIGGKEKPKDFFDYVGKSFEFDRDYTLWIAYHDKKPVASLLLFYFNNTVEYYVPTIIKEYRSIQPLSLIIFKAMADASKKGFKYWNWGGTWPEQEGVYHFKRKWNARNIPYQHFIKVHNKEIYDYSREQVERAFPYFYVIPFDKLNSSHS